MSNIKTRLSKLESMQPKPIEPQLWIVECVSVDKPSTYFVLEPTGTRQITAEEYAELELSA